MTSPELLARLVAFPSVSGRPNADIAGWIAETLRSAGHACEVMPGAGADTLNLFATIGPPAPGGVILSGHMDVVPGEGQGWSTDPFRLREADGRLYGRGSADMKGFLACMLSLAVRVPAGGLAAPIHLCFSTDEEIGCVGVRPMLDRLVARDLRARLCLVGEPTGLRVATGHKGKLAATAVCRGVAAHSALAPQALNAIHLGADLVGILRRRQDALRRHGRRDNVYNVPFSTVHAGTIVGGTALNIVPDRCTVDFEIRTIGGDDAGAMLTTIAAEAEAVAAAARADFPAAAISITETIRYPGLDTPPDAEATRLLMRLAPCDTPIKVAFGTEGGLFAERLGVPTLICGPGSMAQGHKPDEFVLRDQLDGCDAMLDRLAATLSS